MGKKMLDEIREEITTIIKEAPVAISLDEELTNLRSDNAFLRKEQFSLQEKVISLEDNVRDLYRTIGDLQPPEDLLNESNKLDMSTSSASDSGEAAKADDKRWVAFAPTSHGQIRLGAEVKFTRKRDILTGRVKWLGARPKGSNKQFIGIEASEDCDADDCGDLWEGNPKRGILLTVDKIIVAWDWVNVMPKL